VAEAAAPRREPACITRGSELRSRRQPLCRQHSRRRIFRISPEGIFDLIIEYDGEPNGLKIHRDDRIFVADHKQGILLLDPIRGSVSSVVRPKSDRGLQRPQRPDLFQYGRFVFHRSVSDRTAGSHGKIYRLRTDGTLEKLLRRIPSPHRTGPQGDSYSGGGHARQIAYGGRACCSTDRF
jgi:hypothetical protein